MAFKDSFLELRKTVQNLDISRQEREKIEQDINNVIETGLQELLDVTSTQNIQNEQKNNKALIIQTIMGQIETIKENEDFFPALQHLSNIKSSTTFQNQKPEQIACAIGNIFRTSQESVKIFTDCIDNEISKQKAYYHNFMDFLLGGGEIDIIYTNPVDKNKKSILDKTINYLKKEEEFKNKIKLYRLNPKDVDKEYNFVIGDKNMYCFKDKQKNTTTICFNNPDITNRLNDIFEKSKKISNSDTI